MLADRDLVEQNSGECEAHLFDFDFARRYSQSGRSQMRFFVMLLTMI